MKNGRCRLHGGASPHGDSWHVVQPTRGKSEASSQKSLQKFDKRAKQKAERAQRVLAMTPAERERHEDWQRSHRPGKASRRVAYRQARGNAQWLQSLMKERDAQSVSPTLGATKQEIAEMNDVTVSKPEMLEKIETEGIEQAFETGMRILRDAGGSAAAKASVINSFLRAGGFFESHATRKDPADLTFEEIEVRQTKIVRRLELLQQMKSELAKQIEGEVVEDDDMFG